MAELTNAVEMIESLMFVDGTPFDGVDGFPLTYVDEWDDISADAMNSKTFNHGRGIHGALPANSVAVPGIFKFTLNNGVENSASKAGYYSPEHINLKHGFIKGVDIRVGYTYDGSTVYHWRGRLADIDPDPDPNTPWCDVIVKDLMYEFQEQNFKGVVVGTDQRGDQALTTLIAILPSGKQPIETEFDTGSSTYPTVFDTERDEKTSILNVCQKIALSEMGGKIYVVAGNRGEKLVFENRNHGSTEITVQHDFDASIIDVSTKYPADDLITVALVMVHPRDTDDDDVVLGQVQKSFSVGAGKDIDVQLLFRDPNGATRVSAASLAARVSGVDYIASANEDGSGADLTGDMTVTEVESKTSGNSITLNVANGGGGAFWAQTLQQKGIGIYTYDPLPYEERASEGFIQAYGERVLRVDVPYEDRYANAKNYAEYLLSVWSMPLCQISGLTYYPEDSATLSQAFMDIDCGKRITVNLPQVGLDQDYLVRHLSVDKIRGRIKCTYGLAPATSSSYLILDDPVYAKLDSVEAQLSL